MGGRNQKSGRRGANIPRRAVFLTIYTIAAVLFAAIGIYFKLKFIYIYLSVISLVWLIIVFFRPIRNLIYRFRYLHSDLGRIDSMDGDEFEEYLAVSFTKIGYDVEMTGLSRDFGADLILEKDGVTTAVQAKRYSEPVGIPAIQQVYAAKAYYDCDESMVVTNSYYTVPAMNLAEKTGTVLWDRDDICEVFLSQK